MFVKTYSTGFFSSQKANFFAKWLLFTKKNIRGLVRTFDSDIFPLSESPTYREKYTGHCTLHSNTEETINIIVVRYYNVRHSPNVQCTYRRVAIQVTKLQLTLAIEDPCESTNWYVERYIINIKDTSFYYKKIFEKCANKTLKPMQSPFFAMTTAHNLYSGVTNQYELIILAH